MKYLDYFILILWYLHRNLNFQGHCNLVMSPDKKRWADAVNSCTLATPKLVFDEQIRVESFDVNLSEEVWVGYFKTTTNFQYLGCNNKSDLPKAVNIKYNSPGNCTSACMWHKGLLIGLSDNECYCLNASRVPEKHKCTTECRGQHGIACGDTNQISLYSIIEESVDGTDHTQSPGDCVRVEGSNGWQIYWSNCTANHQALCFKADQTVYVATGTGQSYFPWNEVWKKCFQNNSFPAKLHGAKNYTGKSPVWIGVQRSEVIYNYYNRGIFSNGEFEYMYVGLNKEVKFTNGMTEKFYVCTNATNTSLPPTTSTTGQTVGNNQGSNVGMAVGVSVAVVLIAGIVIVVVVILKRRNNSSQKSEKDGNITINEQNKPNDYTEIPDENLSNGPLRYTSIQTKGTYEHSYHVIDIQSTVEKSKSKSPKSDTQADFVGNNRNVTGLMESGSGSGLAEEENRQQCSHTYFIQEKHDKERNADEGTYNMTGASGPNIFQESENVYNKLDNKTSANQDLLNQNVAASIIGGSASENTYDTKETVMKVGMMKPHKETDNVYNKISGLQESDTYNHASKTFCKDSVNLYDKSSV